MGTKPPFAALDPICPSDDERLSAVASRPEIQANFHMFSWRPALVDLRRVLSFQKLINVEGLGERIGEVAATDLDRLLELCLPAQQPVLPAGALTDADGKGFTISSLNPNLRIAGGQLSDAMVQTHPAMPPVRMHAVTLLVSMGTSYLQIVRYRERSFVRDGYHRAAGLLRAGINVAPCILIEARSFEEVGCPSGALSYEVLFGERPPHVADFWGEAARDVKQLAVRKVVRIRGEEFAVPR
jgi:hypothetical protein